MSAFSSDSQPQMAQLVENNNGDTLVEVFRLQDIWQQVAEIVENNKTERFSEAKSVAMFILGIVPVLTHFKFDSNVECLSRWLTSTHWC